MLSIRPQIAKVAKAREFTYVPRYYDERKEKIAEIERQIRKDEDDNKKGDKKVRERQHGQIVTLYRKRHTIADE